MIRLPTPDDARAELERQLRPGERLTWSGQPSRLLRPGPRRNLPTAIVAIAVVLLTLLPNAGFIWGVLVVYLLSLGYRSLVMRGTRYGLTADSAFIVQTFPRSRVAVVDLATCEEIHLEPGRGDRGTLHFGRLPTPPESVPRFEHVRAARPLYQRIMKGRGLAIGAPETPFVAPRRPPGAVVGDVLKILFLLWLAFGFLSIGTWHGGG